MSINFGAVPVQPYIGTPYSIPIQLGARSGRCVPLFANWLTYGVSNSQPNQAFTISLFGGNVALLQAVRSVYIDNLNSNVPIYLQCVDTGFTVAVAPDTAGWYPLFTNNYTFIIAAVGVSINNVPSTRIYFTDIYVPAYSDSAFDLAIDMRLSSPLIKFSGGGGNLSSISLVLPGSNYSGGAMTITGGGGANATAHGNVNQYGQFTSVFLDNIGNGFAGNPIIAATSAQNLTAAWAVIKYLPGAIVNYNGFIWLCVIGINAGAQPPPTPTVGGPAWQQICVNNLTATFSSTFAPASSGSTISASTNYNPAALGDQLESDVLVIAGAGVFKSNLWNTPYGSGFIYLNAIDIRTLTAGTASWQIEDNTGNVLASFASPNTVAGIANINGVNIKLPAINTWRLNCISFTTQVIISNLWAYTYSPL